jgi:hypothetical protein
MFNDLLETRHLLSEALHGLVARGDSLAMLANKSQELESFTQQYHSIARERTRSSTCCALCLLCFVFGTTLGIIIVSFMSVS